MRESEFCIPTSNKAVISITPNWYDRRALDTRSNYALYSSLSHLAILCQTSPKVRESLACDGGLERIVRILTQGKLCRCPEMFQLSKWQQALLCVVNIGVRGSEAIRNRVIEAGIVPILVTILCNALEDIINYDRSTAMSRKQALADYKSHQDGQGLIFDRIRGRAEPAVPLSNPQALPNERPLGLPLHRSSVIPRARHTLERPMSNPEPRSSDSMNVSPMNSSASHARTHRPESEEIQSTERNLAISDRQREAEMEQTTAREFDTATSLAGQSLGTLTLGDQNQEPNPLPINTLQQSLSQRRASSESHSRANSLSGLPPASAPNRIAPTFTENTQVNRGLVPVPTTRPPTTWDQDVTLCLRLLAYLSKYPYLRPDFCKSHDVPQLRQNLKQFEIHYHSHVKGIFEQMDEDLSDSLQIPFNVFHLVEKFTMRIHAQESTYWAGVIMRNSCRRHELGGVRQCAYLECGKWETQNREFAKCRRCRRTKYCSKACQSKAWVGHRYWCSSSASADELP